jgi:uncharacterized protein
MKKHIGILCILLLVSLPFRALAEVWTADNLPMVHLQDARRYVCNPDGVLSEATVDSMDAVLGHLEKTRGVQSVVVVVKEVADGDCYTFGMNLGRKYGIGSKKQQSGLIVVLSTEDRKYYILTGFGLEGSLPDAICKRIENRVMVPLLKEGDWDGAMLQGVKAISGYLQGDKSLKAEMEDDDSGSPVGLFVLLFFIVVFVLIMLLSNALKCPRCGKKALVKTAEKFLYTSGGWDYFQVISTCKHCGYSESIKVRRKHEDNDGGGLLTGILLGSMLGGRGGGSGFGGGFSGGSFGGGGFGGGGAGGGF